MYIRTLWHRVALLTLTRGRQPGNDWLSVAYCSIYLALPR
jgi:hypothetical protein